MPERLDVILTALLMGRFLCFACVGTRAELAPVGARAAVDHLGETIVIRRKRERCHTCGEITETVGIEYATTR